MKRMCKKTAAEQVRLCNAISILLAICIVIMAVLFVVDAVNGQEIDGSRIAIFCADVCMLCLNVKNGRAALEQLEAEKDTQSEADSENA